MKTTIFTEENFNENMSDVVLPWVKSYLKNGTFKSRDGLNLNYYYAAAPESKGAVVFVHGMDEFLGKYEEMLYYFYQEGYSVYFYEQRGHGLSDRQNDVPDFVYVRSYKDYESDLNEFLMQVVYNKESDMAQAAGIITEDREKRRPLYLFAHSMGGATAALFLEDHPDVFKKAVLSSPMVQINMGGLAKWKVNFIILWSYIAHWGKKPGPGQTPFDPEGFYEDSSSISKARYDYQLALRRENRSYQTNGSTFSWIRASVRADDKLMHNAKKIKTDIIMFTAGKDHLVVNEGQFAFEEAVKAAGTRIETHHYPEAKHEIMNADYETICDYYSEIFSFLS